MSAPGSTGSPRPAPAPAGVRPAAAAAAIAIVATAAALRVWNIGAGIPYHLGADEPQVMLRVAHMLKTGDFNPHFFDWPSLTFYLNLVVAAGTFLAGSMAGLWGHLDQVGAPELYLTGRQFTAILGTATVALTFAAGRRWGTAQALVAAALLAVLPGHVRESHYVLTDVPTTFFTMLALVLALRAWERQTMGSLAWASAAAGLAASCDYDGAISAVFPLIVAWTSGGGLAVVTRRTLVVAGACAAAFLAGTPYAILDLPAFLNDCARLVYTFAQERSGEPGWSTYVKHVAGGMTWPALAAAIVGLLVAARRVVTGPDRAPSLMLLAFAALYVAVIAGSFQIYGRYLLPLLAVLSLLAAIAVVAIVQQLRRRVRDRRAAGLVAAAIVVITLAGPAVGAVRWTHELGRRSTIDLAYQWIVAHVPAGSKIAVEDSVLHLPSSYDTLNVKSLPARRYEDYQREGVSYIVAASAAFQSALADPRGNPEAVGAYNALLARTAEVAAFDASAGVSGPSIRVFQLTK